MSGKSKNPIVTEGAAPSKTLRERREFLKKTGTAAISAPAVALLLSVAVKRAEAQSTVPPTSGNGNTGVNP